VSDGGNANVASDQFDLEQSEFKYKATPKSARCQGDRPVEHVATHFTPTLPHVIFAISHLPSATSHGYFRGYVTKVVIDGKTYSPNVSS